MQLLQDKPFIPHHNSAAGDNSDKLQHKGKRTEECLQDESEQVTLSTIFRCKSEYYQQGEKPTRYFLLSAKSYTTRANAISLLTGSDSEDIQDILRKYNKRLSYIIPNSMHQTMIQASKKGK